MRRKQESKLNNLLEPEYELKRLRELCKDTEDKIDNAVEQGNNALLDLQHEFDELASKKRDLLRDIEKLEDRYNALAEKIKYAENTYGGYLEAIKGGKK